MASITNTTYINLSKLQDPPNITIDFTPSWNTVDTGVKTIFSNFPWLEVAQCLGVFLVFYIMFSKQKILNFTQMQNILGASMVTIFFTVGMLYAEYHTSFIMLGTFIIVWLGALITTIRDR